MTYQEISDAGRADGCYKPFCPHCRPFGDEVVESPESITVSADNDDGSRQPSAFGRNRIDSQNIPILAPTPWDMVMSDNDDQCAESFD